jgi:hypothetical protein
MERVSNLCFEMDVAVSLHLTIDKWLELPRSVQTAHIFHYRISKLREAYYNTLPDKRFTFFADYWD